MPTTYYNPKNFSQKLLHYLLFFNNCNHKIKCLEFAPWIPAVNLYQSMFISRKLSCLDITYTCSDRKSKPTLKFGISHSMSCSVVSTCSSTGSCSKTFMHSSISLFSFSVRVVRITCSFGLGRTAVPQKFSFVTREPLNYCNFFLFPEEIPWWHNKC